MRISTIFRVAMWATVGVLIALAWGYYFAGVDKAVPIARNVRTFADMTQPAVAAVLSFDPASHIGLYSGALANAATYALIGVFVETIRRYYRSPVAK